MECGKREVCVKPASVIYLSKRLTVNQGSAQQLFENFKRRSIDDWGRELVSRDGKLCGVDWGRRKLQWCNLESWRRKFGSARASPG